MEISSLLELPWPAFGASGRAPKSQVSTHDTVGNFGGTILSHRPNSHPNKNAMAVGKNN